MVVPLAAGGGLVYAEHPRRRAGGGGRSSRSAVVVVGVRRGAALRHGVQARHGARRALACRCAPTRSAGWPTCRSRARRSCRWRACCSCSTATSRSTAATWPRRSPASSRSRSACRSALLYLGVVIRGLRTGKHRALAAVLLALTGLCHLIPAFFAMAATVADRADAATGQAHPDLARVRVPGGRPAQRVLGAAVLVAARLRERHGLGEAALRHRRERLPLAPRHAVHPRRRDLLEVPDPADGRRDAQRHALGPRPRVRGRRAVDRVPHPGRPLPGRLHRAHGGGVRVPRRGPALERPAAALLLPGPLPAGRHRGGRGRRARSRCSSPATRIARACIGPAVTAGVVALAAFVFVGAAAALAARR